MRMPEFQYFAHRPPSKTTLLNDSVSFSRPVLSQRRVDPFTMKSDTMRPGWKHAVHQSALDGRRFRFYRS